MKKIIIAVFLLAPCFLKAQNTPATQLAAHIAKKMKDTLNLTTAQHNQVYAVNMTLHNLKTAARQQHTIPDSVRHHIQKIENRRDTLYHAILPTNKYLLYKQKKRNLVTNN